MTQTAPNSQTAFSPSPSNMTFEEFLEWGEEGQFAEWVDGELQTMNSPSDAHQDMSGFLLAILRYFAESYGLGKIRSAPYTMMLASRPSGRQPDLLFIANENMERVRKNYLEGPADLVIEIVSPECGARDRGDKFYEYAEAGIREYWLIDPEHRSAEFYQLDQVGFYSPVLAAKGIYQSNVMTGLWLNVEWLWQEPLPTLLEVFKAWNLLP